MCKPHRGGSKAEGMRKICGSKAVKRIFWAHKGGRMRKDGGRSAEDLSPKGPGFSKQFILIFIIILGGVITPLSLFPFLPFPSLPSLSLSLSLCFVVVNLEKKRKLVASRVTSRW